MVPVLCAVMLLAGLAWIAMLSTLNVAAQMALPNWVKARALAVTIVAFSGGMAGGSALWGATATRIGIPLTLTIAALGQILTLLLAYRRRLPDQLSDLTPSLHWPVPAVAKDPEHDRGPVLVTVEYHIEPGRAPEFVRVMDAMRRIRRRDGATSWRLFEDAAHPGRWVELFELESWVEHLRQHERVTEADRVIQESIKAFQVDATVPIVSHLLGPQRLTE